MKLILLLGLSALAIANIRIPNQQWLQDIVGDYEDRDINDKSFRSGREYQFVYDGQLSTGIPGASQQHSSIRLQSVVVLQFKTDRRCLLKLTHIRVGKLNTHLPNPKKMIPFAASQEVNIEDDLKQQLKTPVMFQYNQGLISDVVFDGREQPWSANIKRGVMNMLQVNLQQRQRTDLDSASNTNDVTELRGKQLKNYAVRESTLEGECETFYTLTSQPCRRCNQDSQVLNVTKSVNFQNCQQRPEIRYNFRFQELCPSCEHKYNDNEKLMESSTVARYNISGDTDSFLIEGCKVDSQYTVAPMSNQENVISTYVKQHLRLVKTSEHSAQIQEPSNPIDSDSDMIYSQDWDIMKEDFFMQGEEQFTQNTPYSAIQNKPKFMSSILRKMVNYMQNSVDQEAPRQFNRLVKFLRMLTQNELQQIHQNFYDNQPQQFTPEEHKKIKDLLVDAIALCGTKNCVFHLIEKVEKKQISSFKGAMAIKKLINVRVVSEEMIEKLMSLGESDSCRRCPMLKQSVWLTVGSMMNALCAPNQDQLAKEFKTSPQQLCPKTTKQQFVQKLFNKFKSADNTKGRMLYLKAISNAGIDLSVQKLEQIIRNQDSGAPHSVLIRSEAIRSLRQLTSQMPRKIQRMLMPIFMDRKQSPELRMIAVYQMMQTLPQKPILDQVAQKLSNEPSRQLTTFVYTYLLTMANSTNPCEQRMAKDLQLSLRLCEGIPMSRLMGVSKYVQERFYSDKYNLGLGLDFGAILSTYSNLPRHLATSVHGNMFGIWSKYLLTFGVQQKNANKWIQSILDDSFQGMDTNPRDIRSSSGRRELKNLFEKLGITSRHDQQYQSQQPYAELYMKYKDQEYGFLPISPEIIREALSGQSSSQLNSERMMDYMRGSYDVDYNTATFIHEMSRKIPTSIGIPIKVSITIPTVASIRGNVKLEGDNDLSNLKVHMNVKPSMSSSLIGKVEAWSPIVNSGLKIVAQGKVFTPINCQLQTSSEQAKITCKPVQQKYELLKLKTKPVTYTRVWPKSLNTWEEPEEKTIIGEEFDRVNTYKECFGKDTFGIDVCVHSLWHRTPKSHVSGTPFCPLSGPNKLRVTVQPGHQMPKSVTIKLTGSMNQQNSNDYTIDTDFDTFEQRQDEDEQFFRTDSDDEQLRSQWDSLPEPFRPSNYKRSSQKFSQYRKSYKGKRPTTTQLKVEINTDGSSVNRKCEMETVIKCGQQGRYCKLETNVMRTPIPNQESQPWRMKLQAEVLYSQTPYSVVEVLGKKAATQIKCSWGPQSNPRKRFINIQMEGGHSRTQAELLMKHPQYRMCREDSMSDQCRQMFSPVSQINDVIRASFLNQYRIHVDYNLPVWMQNTTNSVFRSLKQKFFWQTDVAQIHVSNPNNQLKVKCTVDPRNYRYLNCTVKTPQENTTFTDLPLPVAFKPINLRRSSSPVSQVADVLRDMDTSLSTPMCTVNSRRINTFDNVNYRVPLTDCYTVLAKDCSQEQPRFAVLIKKQNRDSEQKKLKVITEQHKIVISTEQDGSLKVKVNGESMSLSEVDEIRENGRVVLRMEPIGQYVKISLPRAGLKVYFDGWACNVKLSGRYQGSQCGLCGNFDGDIDSEFLDARMNDLSDDMPAFHKSYLYSQDSDDTCDMEQLNDMVNDQQQYRYQPFNWESEHGLEQDSWMSRRRQNDFYGDDDSDELQDSDSQEEGQDQYYREGKKSPVLRTKVIEQGHELCFSKVPVPRCPRGTYPISHKQPKKVVYCCMDRDQMEAESYRLKAQWGNVIEQVQDMSPSFTQTELIPNSCRQY
jgi:hypothetical protein